MNEDFMSMKELGALYGVSSHIVGRILKQDGLRTPNGRPTTMSFDQKVVAQRWSEDGQTYFYVWNVAKTVPVLEKAGLKRVNHADVE